jgi:peptide/nickel transport system permease protein
VIPASPGVDVVRSDPRPASRAWRTLRSDPTFWIGAAAVALVCATAVFAPLVAPHDPNLAFRVRDGGLTTRGDPVGFSATFPLGTDRLGRDELSRLIFGARTSLTVGVLANAVATALGTAVGALAGFAGNPRIWIRVAERPLVFSLPVETVLMRATDVTLALPALLLAMALASVVGQSLWLVTAVIAALLWTATARIVYGRVLDVKRQDFVLAARAVGVPPISILVRHVLPHVISLVVVYGTLGISATVLFESTLSFLGAGVPPPTASWGSMISEHISFYSSDPRLVVLPGIAILVTVLGFNLLGDALRDALDPRRAGTTRLS